MKVLIINGSGACVDCDTEYFNGYEWKKIIDYKEREQVLTYDSETKKGILIFPIRYIKESCEKMYHFYDDVFEYITAVPIGNQSNYHSYILRALTYSNFNTTHRNMQLPIATAIRQIYNSFSNVDSNLRNARFI